MTVNHNFVDLETKGIIQIGRGKVISRRDLEKIKGNYPVYSSSKVGDGKFGEYGEFMFNEELITWSVDGGGKLFYRHKHKFSITNVTGFVRILKPKVLNYKYLYYCLTLLHSKIKFDWVKKAHPSILRKKYKNIPLLSIEEQERIATKIDMLFSGTEKIIKSTEKIYEKSLVLSKEIFSKKENDLRKIFQIKQLGQLAKFKNGINYKKVKKGNALKIIGVKNFQSNFYAPLRELDTILYDKNLSKSYEIKNGDIIFVRSNGNKNLIGRSLLILDINEKTTFSGFTIRARLQDKSILPEYLCYIIKSDKVRKQLSNAGIGTNISSLNQKILSLINVPMADLKAQKKLVNDTKIIDNETKKLQSLYLSKINNLNLLKFAFLKQEFQNSLHE